MTTLQAQSTVPMANWSALPFYAKVNLPPYSPMKIVIFTSFNVWFSYFPHKICRSRNFTLECWELRSKRKIDIFWMILLGNWREKKKSKGKRDRWCIPVKTYRYRKALPFLWDKMPGKHERRISTHLGSLRLRGRLGKRGSRRPNNNQDCAGFLQPCRACGPELEI